MEFGAYRLHSAHETSPRALLRRSSDSDMALIDETLRVVGIEIDVAMKETRGELYR